MPLPLLQKLLGHSSIRTTALYWRNVNRDCDDDNDIGGILAGKKWLENREKEPPQLPSENFPEIPKNPEPIFTDKKPVIPKQKSSKISGEQEKKSVITNFQPKSVINQAPPKSSRTILPNVSKTIQQSEISQSLPLITNHKEPQNKKEQILLQEIKQLREQSKQIQAENSNLKILVQSEKQNNQLLNKTITNLTHQIQADKQNHTNLINAYQKAFNDKVKDEKKVNYYQQQLKTINETLKQ